MFEEMIEDMFEEGVVENCSGVVVDLYVDENNGVNEEGVVKSYKSVEEYFNEVCVSWCKFFVDENNYEVIEKIDGDEYVEEMLGEGWNDNLDDDRYGNFCIYCDFLNKRIERDNLIVVKYSLEYDVSWLILKRNDWEKLVKMCVNCE